MDLESELRKAMAEQVAGTNASPSLVTDVKRRHRRRKARIHASAGAAAAAVALAALVPAYQSFRAAPAGNEEAARPADGASALGRPGRPPAPGPSAPPSSKEESGAGTHRGPDASPSRGPERPGGGGTGGLPEGLPRWITYVPGGLASTGPCREKDAAGRETTTCTWRGDAGWVEISVIRGSGLSGPKDLVTAPGLPGRTSVRGAPAIVGDAPGSGRQISWLARPGVGVTVSAGGSVEDQLMRVAEGVRP